MGSSSYTVREDIDIVVAVERVRWHIAAIRRMIDIFKALELDPTAEWRTRNEAKLAMMNYIDEFSCQWQNVGKIMDTCVPLIPADVPSRALLRSPEVGVEG